jgi:16S rRNA (uracil1498-N3)-methyltransferase
VGPLPWERALALAPSGALKLCLWEDATDPLGPVLARLGPTQPVALAVGPEGGLTAPETTVAAAAGYAVLSLGSVVLRTETVAAAVLGAVLVQAQLAAATETPCGS